MNCPICNGTGRIKEDKQVYEFLTREPHNEMCLICMGSGKIAPRKKLPNGRFAHEMVDAGKKTIVPKVKPPKKPKAAAVEAKQDAVVLKTPAENSREEANSYLDDEVEIKITILRARGLDADMMRIITQVLSEA